LSEENPEWTPEEAHPKMVLKEYRPANYKKFNVRLSRGQTFYVVTVFVALLLAVATFLNFQHEFSLGVRVAFVLTAIAALTHIATIGTRDRV
jgi:uncharacterized membrane protein YhaH (DUF805 family)